MPLCDITLSATIKVFDILLLKKSMKPLFLFAAMAVNLVLLWDVCKTIVVKESLLVALGTSK